MSMSSRPRSLGLGELLFRIVVLAALVVGGVVAVAETHAWWTLALALAGLAVTAAAMAVTVRDMVADQGGTEIRSPSRWSVPAAAGVAAVTLVLAVALPDEDAASAADTSPRPADAANTVRAFLTAAVIGGDAYSACEYLTPRAQREVARLAGDSETCTAALTAAQPSFDGVQSAGSLRSVRLRAVVRNGTAYVTASRPGYAPVTVVLRPATPAELATFAPPAPTWRIVSGETSILGR